MRLAGFLLLAALGAKAPPPAPAVEPDPDAARFAAAVKELARDRALPRAIVPLSVLHQMEDDLPDLARLAGVYAEVGRDPRALPEIRALALFHLAGLERSRGNLQKSTRELERLGFLSGWQVAGPFDDEGKRGFDAVYPPEEAIDLAGRYPGKSREVGWRPVPPEGQVMGFVSLGNLLRPNREVTVYALAVVDSPRDQRADLWVGASGAVKAWIDGALVLSDRAYHPARLDQFGARVSLHRGSNRILLKLCNADARLGFYARMADPSGRALALSPVALPPLPPPAKAAAEKPERLDGVVKQLERRVRAARGPDEAAARMDLAVAEAERLSDDLGDRRAAEEARRAAALLPTSVEAQLLAWRLDDDRNRRRADLETALSAHPSDSRVLTALANMELQRSRPAEAARLAARAVAAAPRHLPARLALVQAHEQAGLGARAALEAARLADDFPTFPAAVAAASRAARRLDRLGQASLLGRKQLALRYDDEAARASLMRILLERGEVDAVLELLDAAQRLDPSDPFLRLRRADVLAANGRIDEADAAYAAAARLCPEEAEVHERRGRAQLRAGHRREALASFQRALELKPQNPQLKELVRQLEPERARFETPYLLDAPALARAAPAAAPDDDAVILGELKVTRVFPSGLSATYSQVVVKVLTQRGADAWRSHSIQYAPDRQEVRVERVRVVKPDGSVVETSQEGERSASEPWYRLYYDTRLRTVTVPTLAAGDLLELAYRREDVGSDNLLSDYFGDITFLGDAWRRLRTDYVLLVPEGRKIHANEPALASLKSTRRVLADGVAEYRWTAQDVPRIETEPGMPGWSEVAPYVHVSTYGDWDQVAAFYWRLVRDQLKPGPEVREAAARIAREVAERQGGKAGHDERMLVRAVHDFVVTSTRYVGLEFGIHGYKPYRVDQVLSRRFGDCKDKASLAHALLESLGIDSRIVLLRMRRLGRIPERPASLAVFNHAILYVPKLDLWLDGTAAYSGSSELPGEDQGAAALVVNAGEPPRFLYVPEGRAENSRTESRFDVALEPGGSASVEGTSRIEGTKAPDYRRAYQAEHDRRALLEQAFSRTFPGLRVDRVEVSDLGRIEEPVQLRFTLSAPRYAQPDGEGLRFTPFGQSAVYTESFAPLSSRRYDLVLGEPWEARFTYRYKLPKGWHPVEIPEPARLQAAFGSFEVTVRADGDGLVAQGQVVFSRSRISVADYAAFRDFLGRLDRALARPIRVGPARGAP